ncbi:hypothetical protein TeGR_g1117 [Tetraparma gracilis]|uniref:Protein kinase domain-containing protein n=1 Tax=Tetraparma gracilis TaxID=2962635 RepID=A0ABQ6NBW6_9STRA|nr:hypothetical protein TeGR_g1117 [Tetraparma gracilis]
METQNLTTSSRIIFSASFKDRFGEPFTSAVDFSSFAVKASSDVSTEESDFVLTKTVNGVVSLTDSGVVEFAVDATTPGEWTFSIVDVFNNEYEEHIGDSPYTYAVAEGPTDPAKCTLDSTQSIKAGEEFRVTITTYDFHGNPTNHADDTFLCTLDNDDAVEVARADDGTVEFSKSLLATGAHKLTVLHVPTNTEVAGSPISFEVLGNDNTNTYIAVGVAVFLLLVGVIIFRRHLQRAAMQLKEKELEMVGMDASQKKLEKLHMDLTAEKEELEEEVRLKKHSEEELKVMVSALESVSKERQDELKEVMMESKELKIDKLLGKGGFGVVNLATYRGTMVAMKQLLTVNEENVLRFRHECFLMKNLSHPNVVKLVGVCWSEDLFACCLEFVENGSLEDWLRRTVGGKKDWTLKLTDFGEARAQNMGGTMTSVGTPIYIAPEVMRADHYDVKADTWSYGLCLVAMIRAERTLEQFFYQALRKHKKKRNTKGLGMGQMTKYYYSEGWRPILPLNFVKAYPKLHTLIQECWKVRRKERPNFDQIVARLQGDIGDEIKRKEEPMITTYSLEDDLIYRNRIGKADEIEDSDDEGLQTTGRGAVSRKEYERVKEDFVKVMEELKSERSKKEVLEKDNVKMKKELAAASPTKKEEKEKIKEDKQKMDAQLGALMGGWGT